VQCSNTTFFLFGSNFEVDYGSEDHASIVYKTLAVDTEVKKLIF
jgi:EKC/KEOPS complex subunit PCC1/LAGE3